jgi:hypothetical protein
MPRRDLTVADKTALLEQIKNQPSNTSHHQLAVITALLCSVAVNPENTAWYTQSIPLSLTVKKYVRV